MKLDHFFCVINTLITRSTAACRAVMRLLEFSSGDVYIHSSSAGATGTNPPITIAHHNFLPHLKSQRGTRTRPEVRVTTEHITMTEYPYVRSVVTLAQSHMAKSGYTGHPGPVRPALQLRDRVEPRST